MAADIEGYVAGRNGGPKAYIEADAPISISVFATGQRAKSTDNRPTLPNTFGEFKVGEYLPYDGYHGTVRDPIVGTASLVNTTSISSLGAVDVDGCSEAAGRPSRTQISGKIPIVARAEITSSGNSAEIDARALIAATMSAKQKPVAMEAFGDVSWPIGKFGFQHTVGPTPDPVRKSAHADQVELELKTLFCNLFDKHLSDNTFDAFVSGAAHLGSIDLIRRSVNADGLVLMQGDRSQPATRYLYRAWKAENGQGRGLHFVRTYLQTLFPNACEVNQLWQDASEPYPTALYTNKPRFTWWLNYLGEPGLKLDGSWKLGQHRGGTVEDYKPKPPSMNGMYLTSRIEISLDFSVAERSTADLMKIIRSVLPARLLPVFKFTLREAFKADIRFHGAFSLFKRAEARYPWDRLFLHQEPEDAWKLGHDSEPVKLPNTFGEFKVGEKIGYRAGPKLGSRVFTGKMDITKSSFMDFSRPETLPRDPVIEVTRKEPVKLMRSGRKLNGSWQLGSYGKLNRFKLDGKTRLAARKMSQSPRLGRFKLYDGRLEYSEPEKARLTLSGNWKLGGPRQMAFSMTIEKVGPDYDGT